MLTWQRPDIFKTKLNQVDFHKVEQLRRERRQKMERPHFLEQANAIGKLPTAAELPNAVEQHLDLNHVTIGRPLDLTEEQHELLEKAIYQLLPWRKGPFRMFGHEIDAEWQSHMKWDRIISELGCLEGKQILDVGCGNGYYMFRAAHQQPRLVLGIDPSIPFYLQFELMQRYLHLPNLQYELMGVGDLDLFDRDFDMVWCMGILYHHRNPIEILQRLHRAVRVGGTLIIESQTIPGTGSIALFPQERYAKARNVYFVPTAECLVNWIRRSGFKQVEIVSHTKVTFEEQRSTELAPYESLVDFIDPLDGNQTVEGYPAPYRTVIRAERQFQ
ncbi:MAG: tRNA 5-methoxyuridine(34)/uridine 5-oxyacetic acid(34) synthase CmoB [Mariniblastus sp.]|nr:tRNA 5-methoxyuridine(34)/uridine 5-oxyacetic acid(34) synthase CmoB [Mariniblastus sp.]